ncbi:phospholipase D delta isoform X2 [Aristolochia californica]|uniref:phospholipase D delta isoform X2 n=1 Tax=Aristolochia californica TaxID=171875 RepID=UPI0035DE0409
MAKVSEKNGAGGGSMKVVMLHGDLDLHILEARGLPNMDMFSERIRRCVTVCGTLEGRQQKPEKEHRHRHGKLITSDPYVKVTVAGATVARTRVIPNSQNPVWSEHFHIALAHPAAQVEFQVKDNDVFGAQLIGTATISAQQVASGELIEDWFPVLTSFGNTPKPNTAIRLKLQFTQFEGNPIYRNGATEIRRTYFPARMGGLLKLYQDAHVPDGMLPDIELENGKVYRHEKCWEDICHAILEAHHLIYIVGWSVFHKVRLVRERSPNRPLPKAGEMTLGDLLKYKTQEGVRVCLLVWDDKTSHDKFFINSAGVMVTHDEETRKFFKHSSVICVLSPRYGSSKLSIVKQQADGKGPRQPWHDLHCKIEGPAVYDVLKNFEQRWRKATRWWEFGTCFRRVYHSHDDALIHLERISWILSPSPTLPDDHPILWATKEEDPENWHVQVFRSIDSGSVTFFPKKTKDFGLAEVKEAERLNLVCGKNLVMDKSIHTAYVQAIRSAQHFIYIENQYFLGSSYGWPSYKNAGADNLVPMELALKIASKIRAKERFSVYVVIPMWPEGPPASASVQEILFWQSQTMQMMYEIISLELAASGLDNCHPQDYLNFYCLCNREELPKETQSSYEPPQGNDPLSLAQKFRRFMIYVHAKGMIVDDEYVILGSANINQRSLDGSRDTEIAMGAYQTHYTWAKNKKHPRGQVYGYRMSLWAEHLGGLNDLYKEPDSLECVRYVNQVAEDNWANFTADEIKSLRGHLVKYPLKVEADGKVGSLPGYETFPDVGGKILGAYGNLPDVLTT